MDFSVENCTFCGVYLSNSSLINQRNEGTAHIAPYQTSSEKSIPKAPYAAVKEKDKAEVDQEPTEGGEEALNQKYKGSILPFALLLAGSVFLVFGLILLIFSHEGTLTLHWNASYWFIYLVAAAILLFIGGRSL